MRHAGSRVLLQVNPGGTNASINRLRVDDSGRDAEAFALRREYLRGEAVLPCTSSSHRNPSGKRKPLSETLGRHRAGGVGPAVGLVAHIATGHRRVSARRSCRNVVDGR